MQNQVMQMLMNQLKAKNPQMFQFLEQARKNNNNPVELFNQITQNYTPEQKEKLFNQARQFGVPDEVINGINTKV